MIRCVAVVGQTSNPLYLKSFSEAEDSLKFHFIVHSALDICDEKLTQPKRKVGSPSESYLGLLYPTEDYCVYGYLSNTRIKFILVVDNHDLPDDHVHSFFRRFHSAYVDAASNPFHVPGKRITSPAFAERIRTIVNSFGKTDVS